MGFEIVDGVLMQYRAEPGETDVVIPHGVTRIGTMAFGECANLMSIIIPESVSELDWGAFFACVRLVNIVIPDSVTKIGKGAFHNGSVKSYAQN